MEKKGDLALLTLTNRNGGEANPCQMLRAEKTEKKEGKGKKTKCPPSTAKPGITRYRSTEAVKFSLWLNLESKHTHAAVHGCRPVGVVDEHPACVTHTELAHSQPT